MESGRGFLVIRGLPIERYSDEDTSIIYYGIGLHMGTPIVQSEKGDLLGHVREKGMSERVYEQSAYLPYQDDISDVVGLLSLEKAKSGGLNSLVGSMTVYNENLEKHPELLGLLYRPLYFDHLGDKTRGLSPIFSYYSNHLSCRYMRGYIESGHNNMQLNLSKIELLDVIDSIIHDKDIHLNMMLEPGNTQFANNYTVLHSRTSFEDFDDAEQKRHLLRLWLTIPKGRELASDFSRQKRVNQKKACFPSMFSFRGKIK